MERSNSYYDLADVLDDLATAWEVGAVGWSRLAAARDDTGEPVDPHDETACEFDIEGMLKGVLKEAEMPKELIDYAFEAKRALKRALGKDSLMEFNDSYATNEKKVIRLFRKAARNLREEYDNFV